MFHVPESCRITTGGFASSPGNGPNGAFLLRASRSTRALFCIASDGMQWEHVSVKAHPVGSGRDSAKAAIPTWQEMCLVKMLFWDEEDVVMQLHPRASEYVNNHPAVLHLWRPIGQSIPEPPSFMVGVKNSEEMPVDAPVETSDTSV